MWGLLSMMAVALHLTGTVWAQGPPSVPQDDIQTTLPEILKRLERIEANQARFNQSWDQQLDSTDGEGNGCNSTRFTCLWPDKDGHPKVVRDNETGQMWERFPDSSGGVNGDGKRTWSGAISHCVNREIEGRKGWRLPMREELATLLARSGLSPFLPRGHPFPTIQATSYWTATTDLGNSQSAWFVSFSDRILFSSNKNTLYSVWCVRGGLGAGGTP